MEGTEAGGRGNRGKKRIVGSGSEAIEGEGLCVVGGT